MAAFSLNEWCLLFIALLENPKFATESSQTSLRELTIKKMFKFSTSEFNKICQKFAPSPDRWVGGVPYALPSSALQPPNFELALTPLASGNTVVVELLNSQKLMLEYEKYNELQAKSQRMQEDYENQMREMEKSKQGGLEELTEFYEGKLRETCARLEQVTTSALLTTLYKNYVLRIFVKWTHLLEYCCAFLLIYNQIKKEWNRILLKS